MSAPLVVPDASVILKWVLPSQDEPDLLRAIALRDAILSGEVDARVPTLWLYEVGNTLARRFPGRAARALDVLSQFSLVSAPRTSRWLRVTVELTQNYGVTFYDAAYHAHAITRRGTFVTADEKYIERAQAAGAVTRLADWSSPGAQALRETRRE